MSRSKPTKMTLQDLLRKELELRSVKTASQVSIKAIDGRHLVPDLVLHFRLEKEPNRSSK